MKRILPVIALLSILSFVTHAQVVINEVCPANADLNYDPQFFNFSGWVELYNKGTASVNLGGFYISDKTDQKNKWQIPSGTTIAAKGYLLIWCDDMNNINGLHTNFTLDSDGEDVILSNASLTLVDQINFPEQFTNISFGRTADGAATWSYQTMATPAATNVATTATQRLENPALSLKSGRYASAQTVTMSHSVSGVEIRYTTDGSEPTAASTKYTSAVSVTQTQTVKAKAFHGNYLPSKPEVKTYFINEHVFSLPVFSLSTKPAYLTDNTIGIYVDGTNGITGNCQNSPRNWNQDWDRHAVIEYFKPNGDKVFDQNIDIRIGGACSRGNPQKSFVVKARDKYGNNTIDDQQLFETKDINSFGGFMLRNSGNDFYYTHFRDALMQTIPLGQMDIDYMAYQPTSLYLNGRYWGIMNLREKIDGDFIESNYGIDKDDVDLIETYGNALEGTPDAYATYLSTLQQMNTTEASAFTYIDQNIDVQEYINYLVAEIYYGNTDWPGNNTKFWRQRSTNGKFRWILWDTDFGFALYENQSWATHPTLDFATDPDNTDWPNPAASTLHIRKVLQNPVFRTRFIQTFTSAMGTTFKPDRVIGLINTFQDRIRTEMTHHITRWQPEAGLDMDRWNYEVQRLRNFAGERNAFMYGHLASFFGLGDMVTLKVSGTPVEASAFFVNGVTTDETEMPYFKGLPFEVTAVPKPGYAFKGWKILKRETEAVALINKNSAWKYHDQGNLPAANWMTSAYTDAAWQQGNGQLGYGDGDEQTVVSYGPDAGNKFITTYFRKSISVADTTGFASLSGKVIYDDGVIVYLNGTEVYRGNMPAGAVTSTTLSGGATPTENAYVSFVIPKGLIKPGQNLFAVEIHQNTPGSTDVSFDLELNTVKIGDAVEVTSDEISITDVAHTSVEMKAEFEMVQPVSGIVINEFAASGNDTEDEFGEKDDWIELYNKGTEAVDIAGLFITDKLNVKLKHEIVSGSGNETVINPGAYKLLWADEQIFQGPLHLNFKLSADGEAIGLYQKVGNTVTTLDEVTFDAVSDDLSYSRIPNAIGTFTETTKLTPGAVNQLEIPTAAEEDEFHDVVLYPNPSHGNVMIESQRIIDRVIMYDSRGNFVKRFDAVDNELQTGDINAGLYVLVIQSGSKRVARKFVKR